MRGAAVLGCLATLLVVGQALTPSTYLNAADRSRLKAVFEASVASTSGSAEDISLAVSGLQLLKEAVPATACKALQDKLSAAKDNLAQIYFLSAAGKAGKCSLKTAAENLQVERLNKISSHCKFLSTFSFRCRL